MKFKKTTLAVVLMGTMGTMIAESCLVPEITKYRAIQPYKWDTEQPHPNHFAGDTVIARAEFSGAYVSAGQPFGWTSYPFESKIPGSRQTYIRVL